MIAWFASLDIAEKIFASLAVPATVILVLQSVLLFFGFDGHGADAHIDAPVDVHVDTHVDAHTDTHDGGAHGDGVALFSVRGIVAFFTVGGWLGVVLLESGVGLALTIMLSLIAGFAALYGIALLMKAALRLQSSGNLDYRNAIGLTGRVYLRVPANGKGTGKVNLTVQGRYSELEAITQSSRDLLTDEQIMVTGVSGGDLLIVMPAATLSAPADEPARKKASKNKAL